MEPANGDSSDEGAASGGGGASEGSGGPSPPAARSTEGRVARVAGGDSRSMKPRDVPMASLMGWSNEPEALEALQAAGFDQEAALAALAADYEACGYWRDKFKTWDSAEAEMLCDAVRYTRRLGCARTRISRRVRTSIEYWSACCVLRALFL